MGFKCSVFGCNWGETDVEREREENGSEAITTIRETETCTRCGEVRVVSENTEVTTLETAADIVADDLDEGTGAAESPPPGVDSETGDPPETDEGSGATIPDAESDTAVRTAGAGESGSAGPPEGGEDDAVILDDESEETGATTEEEKISEPESLEETDPDEEAEILEDTDPDEDGERAPGEWPEEPDDGDDWEQPTDIDRADDEESNGFGTVGNTVTVPEGEFYCPECEYAAAVESSSLREGDYCPECHRGSLRHRPE